MTRTGFRFSAMSPLGSAALLALAGFWLSACGGGGNSGGHGGGDGGGGNAGGGGGRAGGSEGSPGVVVAPQRISGTVIGQHSAVQVCVDSDRNFQCDPYDARAQTNAEGGFTLEVPPDVSTADAHLLALIPASAAIPAHTLAAPLAAPAVVSPLSTLWSLRMMVQGMDADAAAQSLREHGLLAAGSQPGEHYVDTGNRAMTALANAFTPAYATAAARPGAGSALQAAYSGAAAASEILARYMDSPGVLLPYVSSKTVLSELPLHLGYDTPCYTQAPYRLYVDTEGAEPVVIKTKYLNASLALFEPGGEAPVMALSTRIRGRGNSTWELEKKPYRLKFDSAAPVLGMPSERDWNLLADHTDKSLLRNVTALCLGQRMGMPYTAQYRPVELTLNDDYKGVYLMTERVELGENRVSIPELGPEDEDPESITGGYLLEIDGRLDEDQGFRSWVYDIAVGVESPDPPTEAQLNYISHYFNAMEEALASPEMNYADYLDVESLVDYYLLNELLRNVDAFRYSAYLHKDRGGKLAFGPIWDFDLSADNALEYEGDRIAGWFLRDTKRWVARFFEDPRFARHVQARWSFLKAQLPYLQGYIQTMADHYTAVHAQQRNFDRWDILDTVIDPGRLALSSYEDEVYYLREWIAERAAWMDEAFQEAAAEGGASEVPRM